MVCFFLKLSQNDTICPQESFLLGDWHKKTPDLRYASRECLVDSMLLYYNQVIAVEFVSSPNVILQIVGKLVELSFQSKLIISSSSII